MIEKVELGSEYLKYNNVKFAEKQISCLKNRVMLLCALLLKYNKLLRIS